MVSWPTMLGGFSSVLTVVCKRMQQLPTILLGPALHCGKKATHKTLKTPRRPCVMRVRGLNIVGRAVQSDPTL